MENVRNSLKVGVALSWVLQKEQQGGGKDLTLGAPCRRVASFQGCKGVQTKRSEEGELWSGYSDDDDPGRLPGRVERAGSEIWGAQEHILRSVSRA